MTKQFSVRLACSFAVIIIAAALLLHFKSVVKGNLYAVCDLARYPHSTPSLQPPVDSRFVAHAGGGVRGLIYTNSREALDENYAKGYRVFELDFEWTTDNHLVLVHEWPETSSQFGVTPHIFSYREFVGSRRLDGLHQLTFEDLQDWLRNHTDAFVVTDTKASNLRLLQYFRSTAGGISPQLIVQIYRLNELKAARSLRPRAVWLTIYKCNYPAWALSRIAGVDAFVIPASLYANYSDPPLMAKVHFYAHSVPAESAKSVLQNLPGLYGLYVD